MSNLSYVLFITMIINYNRRFSLFITHMLNKFRSITEYCDLYFLKWSQEPGEILNDKKARWKA